MFTDGISGGQSLGTAVQQLKNKGVIVFAIAVGDKVDTNQLRQMTMRDDLVFQADDFLDLYVKAGAFSRKICQHARKFSTVT